VVASAEYLLQQSARAPYLHDDVACFAMINAAWALVQCQKAHEEGSVGTAEADAVLKELLPNDHLLADVVLEAGQHHRLQLLLEVLCNTTTTTTTTINAEGEERYE
jgi:hypothetical protein